MPRAFAAAVVVVAAGWLAACSHAPAAARSARAEAGPDLAAARREYDRGVRLYGADQYAQAKAAWLSAARRAPGTELARKAQENAARADAVLRKLRELEAQ